MRVRFLRSFRGHDIGSIVEVAEDIARYWMDVGIVQPVPEEKSLDTPVKDKALRKPSRKKAVV